MDRLEAQYGGYFIKNIRKLAFFWKKNAQKLASFKKSLIPQHYSLTLFISA